MNLSISLLIYLLCCVHQVFTYTVYDLVNGLFCGNGIPVYDGTLVQASSYKTLPANIGCVIGFMSKNHKMLAVIQDFNTEGPYLGNCEQNRLDIYDGIYKNATSRPDKRISGPDGLCGNNLDNKNFVVPGPNISFVFRTYKKQIGSFHIVVTPFHDTPCNTSREFQCKNGRCIDKSYRCDFYNNCGDNSDESTDTCVTVTTTTVGEVVGIIIGALIVLVVIIMLLKFIYSRKRREYGFSRF